MNTKSLEKNLINDIKKEFPILNTEGKGKKLVYLDSAASSQKPREVIESIKTAYEKHYANVHRGVYELSQIATEKYEEARGLVFEFLNARHAKEIIFTRGATEGLNLIANCLQEKMLREGDEVIISTLEHHSNIIPWQIACKKSGANIIELKPDEEGNIGWKDYERLISNKTKIISLPHITNSIGSILPVKEICHESRKKGVITVVDGCQAAPHLKIDVQDINADFYVFSGHKIYAPSGIGVLYGRKEILETLDPYQTGGEMIDFVSIQEATYASLPHKFEAGTPNIVGAISLGKAINFIKKIGINNIQEHSKKITHIIVEGLLKVDGVKIIGNTENRISIVSFVMNGAHPHDLALLLDKRGIAARAGHHCAQPAMRHFGVDTTLRVSAGIYNDEDDIAVFLQNLRDLKKYF